MLTEEEFMELVEAITKPIDSRQIRQFGLSQARELNKAEAFRAAKALMAFYEKKRQECNK